MATLEELIKQGLLREHTPDMEQWEMPERHLYLTTEFGVWRETVLEPAARLRGRNLVPYEQVEQLFYEYVLGKPMAYSVGYRKLDPHGQHIWELKTEDMRVFGWFVKKKYFVATSGEFKDKLSREKQKVSTNKLYKPFIEGVWNFREALDLDQPKFISGIAYHDIL